MSGLRIGIYGRGLENETGIGTYAHGLVRTLIEEKSSDEYSVFLSSGSSLLNSAPYKRVGVPIPGISHRITEEQLSLPFCLRRSSVQVFHSLDGTLPLFMPSGIRPVITVLDVAFLRVPDSLAIRSRLLYCTLIPRAIARAAAVITISEFSKREIIEAYGCSEDMVHVTYCGVDSVFKPVGKEERAKVKKQLEIPDGEIVLYIGAIEQRKNLVRLAEAVASIESPSVRLVIAGGKGRHGEEIETQIRKILGKRVHFTGYVPDESLPALYSCGKVFVFPSLYEGFGLPPLEAMACGVPVAVSNTASMPEVAGDAGEYFDPTDVSSIQATLIRVLDNDSLRAEMSARGIELARNFTWQEIARRTRDVYHKVSQ